MSRTARRVLVGVGTACFAAAAAASFGWIHDVNSTGLALSGLGCWLASTYP